MSTRLYFQANFHAGTLLANHYQAWQLRD